MIGKALGFHMDDNGTLWFGKRLCVPEKKAIQDAILREAHESAYSIHPRKANVVADALSRKSYANEVQVAPM